MRVIDLSHPLAHGMPVYPGDEAPSIITTNTLAADHYNQKRLTLSTHTGTHMDAPAHLIPHGKTLDQFPPEHFIGPGIAIDARNTGTTIPLALLLKHETEIRTADYFLLCTGWDQYWGTDHYFTGYPCLAPEAAAWLATQHLKGLGTDTCSPDPVGSPLPNHHTLLSANILLLENLRGLTPLLTHPFTLLCPPLPLAHADGAPMRALAMLAE